ncbi:MAG: PAS domain-containing protein [Anaerolineae bacterium]|nr:PAS domain-containing protein [Anaerolineae bacterium]
MRLGMRWRIALPYMTVVLVASAVLGLYLSQELHHALMESYRVRLLAEASLVRLFLTEGPAEPDHLREVAGRWSQQLDSRLTLINRDGVVLADSHFDPAAMDNHLARPEVQEALAEGAGASARFSHTTGYNMLYVALDPKDTALPIIRVSASLQEIDAGISRMQTTLMATALGASALVMALSFVLADRITRPLRRLTDRVLSYRSSSERAMKAEGYDEVQSLADAFGQMTSELGRRVDALAEERNKIALVLAHLNDGVLITDSEGVVHLINPAAVRLLDLTWQSDPIGRPLMEVVGSPSVLEAWKRCRETGQEQETMIEVPDRGAFVRLVVSPIAGSPLSGEMLLLQDLTQVRRLESVRRDFISNISHELRTPLASLKALVDTLQDGALEDPTAARNFLQRMEIEVDSLTQMVQELLELSRIESGQVPIRLAPVLVAELLAGPLEHLQPQAERARLEVAVNLVPDGLTVLADQERTRQVITNLVHNAIKFTPPGGRISVSAIRAGDEVVIAVADTGIGIPEKDLPRIFERFYKADRARASGGTGLGLAIAKHIVQAHGGRIWVKSQEGAGSTFYFTLPAA